MSASDPTSDASNVEWYAAPRRHLSIRAGLLRLRAIVSPKWMAKPAARRLAQGSAPNNYEADDDRSTLRSTEDLDLEEGC